MCILLKLLLQFQSRYETSDPLLFNLLHSPVCFPLGYSILSKTMDYSKIPG